MTILVSWTLGLLLLTFAEAAVAHVREPNRVRQVLYALGLRFGGLTFAVSASDFLVVVLLIAEPRLGSLAAGLYLIVVSLPLAFARRAGVVIADCGCGTTPKAVSGRLFVRNALLVAAALVVEIGPQ